MKLEKTMEIVKAIAEAGNNKFDELSNNPLVQCSDLAMQELSLVTAAQKLVEMRVDNIGLLEELVDFAESEIPSPSCSCHLSPPCNDCADFGGIRETIEVAKLQYES